jgi:hypothetical protein
MADSLEGSSLIMSRDAVNAAYQYKQQLDELGDTWEALKTTVGTGIIPILIKVSTEINKYADESIRTEKTQKDLDLAYQRGQITMIEGMKLIEDMRWTQEGLNEAEAEAKRLNAEYVKSIPGLTEALTLAGSAAVEASGDAGMGAFNRSIQDASQSIDEELIPSEEDLKQIAEEAALAQEILRTKLSDLQSFIAGALGNETDSYKEKVAELNAKMAETQTKIDELNAKEYLTDAQKEELSGLQNDLGNISLDIKKTADAHDEATKRIMLNILTQRAAMNGLTSDELLLLNSIALNWGLVDQATYNYTVNADAALTALGNGAGFDVVQSQLLNTAAMVRNIPTSWQIDITTVYHEVGTPAPNRPFIPEPKPKTANARGADYIVPPGYSGERWNIGTASSGERVTITPVTNNNFSMNVHTNASSSTLTRDYAMMRARIR